MALLFFALYLTGLSVVTRFRLAIKPAAALILILYFLFVQSLITLFVSVEFINFFWKSVFFLSLVALPTILIAAVSQIGVRCAILGCALSFLLILPITRPTISTTGIATEIKARYVPTRFLENLSRLPSAEKNAEALIPLCSDLPEKERSLLYVNLRPFLNHESPANDCLEAVERKSELHPESRRRERHSAKEWLNEFQTATPAMRAAILDELRQQRNPALVDQAVEVLEGDQDALIISGVRYLREISGKMIGNDKARWKRWRGSKIGRLDILMTSSAPAATQSTEKRFSAVAAFDDLRASQMTGQDFLQLYLKYHCPRSITENDLQELNDALGKLKGDSIPIQYRRGVLLFFIALAQTKRIADGFPGDAGEAFSHWQSSLDHFRKAEGIGNSMADEVTKIISVADENRDQKLDSKELKHIIQSRS